MIDTVTMVVEGEPNLKRLSSKLDNLEEVYNHRSEMTTFRGNLGNMYLRIDPYTIKINGSLKRYFKWDNLQDLTFDEIETALNQLTLALNLNIADAWVWRFDMACNLIMIHPVDVYLDLCERAQSRARYQRAEYSGETVRFANTMRTVQLYDKMAEMKSRKRAIPEELKCKNILRCEVQFKKRLSRQFGTRVSAKMLCDSTFYSHVLDKWETEFLEIRLRRKRRLLRDVGVKDLMDYLALLGVESLGGEQTCLDMLNDARRNGLINSVKCSRMKNRLDRLIRQQSLTEYYNAAEELRTKIKNAAAFHRRFLH